MADHTKRRKAGHVSAKHALSSEELRFCQVYASFGFENHTDAYRRAFYPKVEQRERTEDGTRERVRLVDNPDLPNAREVTRKAGRLLKTDYIQRYLDEIAEDTGTHARGRLADQVLFGDEQTAARAAQRILDQEDKLGFRDASEAWAEIMCAIGAEVVVPLPGGADVAFPLGSMFPSYKDALPPADVLEKTIKSLEDYRAKVAAQEDPA